MSSEADTQGEQLLYANVLAVGMYIGLMILFITFALYVTGLMEPAVPLDQVSQYWHLGIEEYLHAVNHDFLHRDHLPTGWAWIGMLGKGDFLNFLGIAILAGTTIGCYLAIVPALLRQKDGPYVSMVLLEVVVLALAASGLLAVGH